jgi:hypothetical protein
MEHSGHQHSSPSGTPLLVPRSCRPSRPPARGASSARSTQTSEPGPGASSYRSLCARPAGPPGVSNSAPHKAGRGAPPPPSHLFAWTLCPSRRSGKSSILSRLGRLRPFFFLISRRPIRRPIPPRRTRGRLPSRCSKPSRRRPEHRRRGACSIAVEQCDTYLFF